MKTIECQLKELSAYFPKRNEVNKAVSKVSVGWHLDHSLRVMNSISRALEQSNPKDYKKNFSFWRTVFFALSYIPRGKGKSPKQVKPDDEINLADLEKRLKLANENIKNLTQLPQNANFPHPYFGQLNLMQSVKFIRIHTKHHLKIIKDILK